MFACFNPTYYANWPDKLQARKEIVPGQTMRVTLPPEFAEVSDEIQKAINESFEKITRSEATQIEQSGKIKDGSSWKITFKKNENTRKVDCNIELFPLRK